MTIEALRRRIVAWPASGPAWLRWLGLLVGAVLLGGAVLVVAQQHEHLRGALAAVGRPALGPTALLLASVAINVAMSGLVFQLLISRYGRVGVLEMQAVIASATLLNFLPLRPGLFGRIAYHHTVNGIAVVDSAKTVVQAIGLSAVVAAYLVATLLITAKLAWSPQAAVILPIPVLAVAGLLPVARVWAWAGLARYLDVLVWSLRYHAAFMLIGWPIGFSSAVVFACLGLIANLIPLLSNGLGAREWAIGLTAPLLTCYGLGLGLTAELINRAAELLVVVPLGLCGLLFLARRRGRQSRPRRQAMS